jgi:hypothetical protein
MQKIVCDIIFCLCCQKITDKAILAGLGTFSQTDKQFVGFVPGVRLCILGTRTHESCTYRYVDGTERGACEKLRHDVDVFR